MNMKKLSEDSDNFITELLGGQLKFGEMVHALRLQADMTQEEMAKKLKIKKSYLCDIEKGRRLVSPYQASRFAKLLKHPESFFIKLALDDILRRDHLNYQVELNKVA